MKRHLTLSGPAGELKISIWIEVFGRLRDDGELHRDDLPRALELCGIHPTVAWIDEVFESMTKFSSLGAQEFITFVHKFLSRQSQAFTEYFAECDEDGSGQIDCAELAGLLKRCQIEPMRHVLVELVQEMDADNTGDLDLKEFQDVIALLWTRAGFTKQEYQGLLMVYNMFDRDNSGEIDTRELVALLNWLGYAFDKAKTNELAGEVDVDGSGMINEREFIMCMRKVRERELALLRDFMHASDADGSGTVSGDEIMSILKMLGYDQPDYDAVREAAEANGLDLETGELDLTDLWQLLSVYRNREGLSGADINLIQQAFQRYDKENTGEVSTAEIGKMLRWLGYSASFEVLQKFIACVDVDESGKLEEGEFRKMLRMFRQWEHEEQKEAWESAAHDNLTITKQQMCVAIEGLGLLDLKSLQKLQFKADELIPSLDPNAPPRFEYGGFMKVVSRLSKVAREAFRSNGGFSVKEVQELQRHFHRYDADGSGDISNKELILLIEELFPQMANDRNMRPRLLEIMREVDSNSNGSLDFQDFIRLMKQFRELQDRERIAKELRAVQETGFTSAEVSEFRELFLGADQGGSGELSLEEVTSMINMITPLGDLLRAEMTRMFRKVTGQQCRVEGAKDQADFPEFLWFMKDLLENNFANIKDKTKKFSLESSP